MTALWAAISLCSAANINLNFFVGSTKVHSESVAANGTYTLASFVSGDTLGTCRGWTFAGWNMGTSVREGDNPTIVTTVTPSANLNLYAVFSKAGNYTSYLDYSLWDVALDALDGTISGYASSTAMLTETSVGAAINLPTADLGGGSCAGWSFYGWHRDSIVKATTTVPSICANPYYPAKDGEKLYAVYHTDAEYELVESADDLEEGKYLIVYCLNGRLYRPLTPFDTLKSGYRHLKTYDMLEMPSGTPFVYVLKNPEAYAVWTLSGSADNWHWKNDYANKYLYFADNNTDIYMSDGPGGSFALTIPNSDNKFDIESEGRHLDVWDMGTHLGGYPSFSGEAIYLYKQKTTATYSSYTKCKSYVILHACGGRLNAPGKPAEKTYTEASAGDGIELPTATGDCGWAFHGWKEGSEASLTRGMSCAVISAGTVYHPQHDTVHLYAVYQRLTGNFNLMPQTDPVSLAGGDTYLVSCYGGDGSGNGQMFKWLMSAEPSGNWRKAKKGYAPANTEGLLQTSDSSLMWVFTQTSYGYSLRSVSANKYMDTRSNGLPLVDRPYSLHVINAKQDGYAVVVGLDEYSRIYYDSIDGVFKAKGQTVKNGRYNPYVYLYRSEKDFASRPQCDRTVYLDACSGVADTTSLAEEALNSGVELPEAYVGVDCSREGWTFVGWAHQPVREVTKDSTFVRESAHALYQPLSANDTLYAVYRNKSDYYSYPDCHQSLDAIYWEKDGSGNCFVTVESYVLTGEPEMHGSVGSPVLQADGTYRIQYDPTLLPPCSKTEVAWDNTSAQLRVPFIVDSNTYSSELLPAQTCDSCDVYVMTGNMFTVDEDRTLHMLTVQDGATLSIEDGYTLNLQSLVLFAEGDQSAANVDLNNSGAIELLNNEIYHDRRVDDSRWYWFTLPYDAHLKEINYACEASNGGAPTYWTDYFIKYYDGAGRARDANNGSVASTYWTEVVEPGKAYMLRAGQGYQLGIADQATVRFNGQNYSHTKRVVRFTMRPGESWIDEEHDAKLAPVVASVARNAANNSHAGWNLIGNPFMRPFALGEADELRSGAWTKEMDGDQWTGHWIVDDDVPDDVPYLTIYDPVLQEYSQVLASSYRALRPFEAVFVQINDGTGVCFGSQAGIKNKKCSRYPQSVQRLYTGIRLTDPRGKSDCTGVVLGDEYTQAYEIGGDLAKSLSFEVDKRGRFSCYKLNLYTIDRDNHQLAFNAMSDSDAVTPIPVGITVRHGGVHTFSFDTEQFSVNAVDSVLLIDNELHTTTDLRFADYTFTASAGTINNRFALVIYRAQSHGVATDIEQVVGSQSSNRQSSNRKYLNGGQLFIIRDGKLFTAQGSEVK
ncbi:MAG: InlB B-repeat-containing protein [Paludibacteraceae bacterium]|nr:InlB B-repeat-containing protein [Paludibacteraceae bacterium]